LGCLGSQASTEKKSSGPIMTTFEGGFFMFSGAKKLFLLKNIAASALKS
jgi:hypothetical protein